MIPKVIHYCWFGKGKKGEFIENCIKSWKKYCPEYEIIEWSEDNFDFTINKFAKEAYEAKKWAFVSDYVRMNVLYNYGGIYLDTDVELLKSLDEYLNESAFVGFETNEKLATSIIGAEKHNDWIKYLFSYYDGKSFINEDGGFNIKTNVEIISQMTKEKYKVDLKSYFLEIPGILKIYPREYFCPKEYETGLIELTDNTVCIHHFNASWHDKLERKMYEKKIYYIKKYGKEIGEKKYDSWYKRSILEISIRKYGIKETVKKIKNKLLKVMK